MATAAVAVVAAAGADEEEEDSSAGSSSDDGAFGKCINWIYACNNFEGFLRLQKS